MGLYDFAIWDYVCLSQRYELRSDSRNTFMSDNTRLERTRQFFSNRIPKLSNCVQHYYNMKCRVSRRSKRFSIKASIHKTANIKAHIKGTSTSKIKHMSITAKYNKGINQYTHHPPSKSSHSYLQIKSMKLGFCFLTPADLLIGTSVVVEDFTTNDESLLVTHVEVCSVTLVVVLPSVVDLAVTISGATVVGQAKGAVWLVLGRIVLSSESSLVSHAVLLPFRTVFTI